MNTSHHRRPWPCGEFDFVQYSLVGIRPIPNLSRQIWYKRLFPKSRKVSRVKDLARLKLRNEAIECCQAIAFECKSQRRIFRHHIVPSLRENRGRITLETSKVGCFRFMGLDKTIFTSSQAWTLPDELSIAEMKNSQTEGVLDKPRPALEVESHQLYRYPS